MMRLCLIFAICLPALFFSGCDSSEETPLPTPTSERPTVLLVMKSLVNPFYIEMEKGARQAANELGVDLIVKSGTNETLVAQQIELIDEQLAIGIDALIIAPADSIAILSVLARAHEMGVKIVNIDNQIDPEAVQRMGLPPIPFISVDNQMGGYHAGQELAKQATLDAKALIIEGPRSAINARQRRDGAQQALLENNVTIVASEEAHWKLESAYALVTRVHAQHPDLSVIFAANDMMALGALLYAQENNLDEWIIGGYDNIPDVQTAVMEGLIAVTIDQQADQQGYQGVATAVDLINGNSVKETVVVDTRTVKADGS